MVPSINHWCRLTFCGISFYNFRSTCWRGHVRIEGMCPPRVLSYISLSTIAQKNNESTFTSCWKQPDGEICAVTDVNSVVSWGSSQFSHLGFRVPPAQLDIAGTFYSVQFHGCSQSHWLGFWMTGSRLQKQRPFSWRGVSVLPWVADRSRISTSTCCKTSSFPRIEVLSSVSLGLVWWHLSG